MVKKIYFLVLGLSLFACSSSIFNKVHINYDTIKNEQLALYNYDGKAVSIWKKSWGYPVHLQFKDIKGAKRHLALVDLSLNLVPSKKMVDTLYVKVGEDIFKIKAKRYSIVHKQITNRNETQIIQDNNKKDDQKNKEVIKTECEVESYPIEKVYLTFQLPGRLLQHLQNSDRLLMQFYVNDTPYIINFSKLITNKIKKVYFKKNK